VEIGCVSYFFLLLLIFCDAEMNRNERDSCEERNEKANQADSVEERIDQAAKTIVYQEIEGKSEYQVQETGIFNGVELKDKSIKSKVQRRLGKYKHENKISGRPSLDNVQNRDAAFEYAKRRVANTPSTERFVESNYANVLVGRGYPIQESALKGARRRPKKPRIADQVTKLAMKCTTPLLLTSDFSVLVPSPPQPHVLVDQLKNIGSDQSEGEYFGSTGDKKMSEDEEMSEESDGVPEESDGVPEESDGVSMHPQLEQSLKDCVVDWMNYDMMPLMANDSCSFDDILNNDFDYKNVEGAVMNLVTEIHSRKESFLTSIFAGYSANQAFQTSAMSLGGADPDETDRYPALSQYGIPYHDEHVCGNIL
jgi:hypothetical protein